MSINSYYVDLTVDETALSNCTRSPVTLRLSSIIDPPDLAVHLSYDKVADLAIRKTDPNYFYLGYLGDQPVATSVSFLGADVAWICDVVTAEWARGQGIGSTLTMTALTHSAERGSSVATLQASDQAQSLYIHIGFRSCCAFQTYQ